MNENNNYDQKKYQKTRENRRIQLLATRKNKKKFFLLQYNTFIAIAAAIHGTSKEKTSRTWLRIP